MSPRAKGNLSVEIPSPEERPVQVHLTMVGFQSRLTLVMSARDALALHAAMLQRWDAGRPFSINDITVSDR